MPQIAHMNGSDSQVSLNTCSLLQIAREGVRKVFGSARIWEEAGEDLLFLPV